MKKEIPIFFACDDNYIPFLGTAIHTLIKNASKDYHYRAIVLNAGIKEENKARVKALENEHLSIDFFNIEEVISKHYDELALRLRDYYSVAIYYRMFIATLFPQYEKAIYLDADLILVGDISELYHTNIEGKLVGAINDRLVLDVPEFAAYASEAVGIAAHEYFNSGVLVMNLKKFREDDIENKFLHLLETYNFDSVCPDQDYLNVLCRNDKVLLPIGWNKMPLPDHEFDYATLKLLHYNSFEKPWHHDHVLYSKEFWDAAVTSPFYDDLIRIKQSVDAAHLAKEEKGVKGLFAKAIHITNNEEVTFKKILAL
jgi:lipopolysaccharide biosynthesis glycosyltransferase